MNSEVLWKYITLLPPVLSYPEYILKFLQKRGKIITCMNITGVVDFQWGVKPPPAIEILEYVLTYCPNLEELYVQRIPLTQPLALTLHEQCPKLKVLHVTDSLFLTGSLF